ncbi:DHA2 family efflux MFS transporter permease subunit [uncultured Secundilactobacillus sp.]|uniref:DHA2 family efflux MFS transporter permease subunit n=1 Tax=uncultured Secundilactobacillus sp. TaxID=2813935 RepID=UPI00258B9394|nr:DHA2 family efflux MFS transporter permease subunit [uncultured Secundilactobacillus sp.]
MENNYKKWLALVAMSLGTFMGLLDVTVVNVALPALAKHFNETFTNLQWVLNIYTLVLAISLLIVSKLGDMFGRKKIFLLSIVIFVIASAINGLAPNAMALYIGRGIQAIGGAGMNSLAMALVATNFQGKERGVALGILGSVIGISTASGPLIGGYLVETFGWSSIFYINVPIGIIAILLTLAYVKETPSYGAKERVDFGGMVLSALTLFSLIYGLIQKEGHANWGWTNMNILSWLIAAVISFIAFIWVESRVKQPMIDLAMFKSRHLIGTLTVAVALGISLYSFNAFLTVLMQNYLGYTAFQTGLRQLTISIWSLILGPVTGALGNRFAKNKLIGYSLFIGAIGFVVFMNAMVTHLSFNQMWPAMILMGITNGMVNPLLNSAGLEGVALKEMGLTSGLINVFRQIGTTLGVVGLGLVQSNRYESYLNTHMTDIAAMPASVAKTLTKVLVDAGPFAGHGIAFSTRMSHSPFAAGLQTVVLAAYSAAMRNITLVAAVVLVIAGIAALTLMHGQQHSVDIKQ